MTTILEEAKRSICSGYSFENLGNNEYLVHTGMCYDDGDEFHIVMTVADRTCTLTDEGHTMMWLSYENYHFTKMRKNLLDGILCQNGVTLDKGCISVTINDPADTGPALTSLIQAMMQTADLRYLSHGNVVSTFLDDIRSAFASSRFSDRCEFGKRITVSNGNSIEPDICIDNETPVLVFGAGNTERAKEVFIDLLLLRDTNSCYRTVVVIDGDAGIPQKDRDRLINAADRPVIGAENAVKVTAEFIGVRRDIL